MGFSAKMMHALAALMVVATMLGTAAGQQQVPQCAQNLVPCANYLGSPKPAESCCRPVREAVRDELPCLCSLFNTPQLLKAFNINLTQALDLPKNCGIQSNQSICSNSASTSTSPAHGSSVPASSTTPTSPSSSTVKTAGAAGRSSEWMGVASLSGLLWLWWAIVA